jgi:hypothetical protein
MRRCQSNCWDREPTPARAIPRSLSDPFGDAQPHGAQTPDFDRRDIHIREPLDHKHCQHADIEAIGQQHRVYATFRMPRKYMERAPLFVGQLRHCTIRLRLAGHHDRGFFVSTDCDAAPHVATGHLGRHRAPM